MNIHPINGGVAPLYSPGLCIGQNSGGPKVVAYLLTRPLSLMFEAHNPKGHGIACSSTSVGEL